jgi:2-iminobutanoate/2-iminopropanoate deaminase
MCLSHTGLHAAALAISMWLYAGVPAADAEEIKPVYPGNAAKPVGPYTPGLIAGDFLYVSGQGARDANGSLPSGFEAQTRQCLENVKAVVQAAGLQMENVVYAQVYLAEVKNYSGLNKVFSAYFPKNPPARSITGVARMPTDTPVEISAVAVRDARLRKSTKVPEPRMEGAPISSGVEVGDRFYLGGVVGRDLPGKAAPSDPRAQVDLMLARAAEVLKSAGLDMRHMASATLYIDPKMPLPVLAKIVDEVFPTEAALTVIQTDALPLGAHIEMTGVFSREMKRLGHCNSIAETVYCRARSGTVSEVMKELEADIKAAKLDFSRIVASNVYLDSIENFNAMNKVYGSHFGRIPPTRTTVQPATSAPELILAPNTNSPAGKGEGPRVQISVTAIQ